MKDGVPVGWRKTPIAEQTSFLDRGIASKYDDAAKGRSDCAAYDLAIKQLPRARSVALPEMSANELPAQLRATIEPLKVG